MSITTHATSGFSSPDGQVTPNVIRDIFQNGTVTNNPILQIIDLKRISSSQSNTDAPPRFRLAISDGSYFQQAMIATQLNAVILENDVRVNALIRVKEIICNNVQGKRIVIILNLELAGSLPHKVGNPVSIDSFMAGNNKPPANQPPQQMQQPQNQMTPSSNNAGFSSNNHVQPAGQQPPQNNGPGFGAPMNGGFGTRPSAPGFTGGPPAQQQPNSGFGGFGSRPSDSWQSNGASTNPFSGRGGGPEIITKTQSNPSSQFRPIQTINPYQNGWTIRGRCTFKSDMRQYQNARGPGQVISFELTDQSGSIRITGFQQAASMIEETVHANRIYKVSRGFLKQANEKFNRSTSSFEMTIDNNALLEEVDDDGSVMSINYKFVKIAELDSVPVKGNCDVVGVVTAVGPVSEIVIRSTGEPCKRRSITITDDSNASVELTLWRAQAENFITEKAQEEHPVLIVRNGSRGDFGGVSLNVSRMTTLELNPVNIPDANKLRTWFDAGGLNAAAVQSVTSAGGAGMKISGPRKSLMEAKVEVVDPAFSSGNSDAGASFVTRAIIAFVNTKNDIYYPSDPVSKRKVIQQNDGMWLSESSGTTLTEDQVQYRYIVSLKVSDHSSSQWVTGFDEVGTVLFGRSAGDLRKLNESDRGMFEQIVDDSLCRPMLLKMQVKERMWKDEKQIRYTIARAEMIDFATEGHNLLDEIKMYGTM